MDLTPREIQDKQFHDAFRGYAHEEVDAFLDEVAAAFEKVYRDNQSLHHRLRDLEEQYSQARTTEDMLKRTLLTAQRTADEAIEEARAKATQMVEAAQARSKELEEAGARKAEEITKEAVAREREIQFRLEGLKHFEREYKARLRAFIESQLRVLDEGPSQPDPMEAISAPAIPEGEPVSALEAAPESEPTITVEEDTPLRMQEDHRPSPVTQGSEEQDFAPRAAHVGAPMRSEAQEANETRLDPIVSFSPSLAPPSQEGQHEDRPPSPPSAEEEKSIKELFWGEED